MDLFLIKHKLQHDFPLVRETTLPHPQRAAVMVLLYPKPKKTHVLMTRRAMHLKYHAGEVSFPGGVFEEQDDDLLATALRETEEELAIQVQPEDVLGQLFCLRPPSMSLLRMRWEKFWRCPSLLCFQRNNGMLGASPKV